MPDLVDLFPGFGSHTASTEAGRIFARTGGSGPPLLLLHGFPETGAMWHKIAPRLAQRFTLVIPDLRGYGWSSAPASQGGEAYTKRVMGGDMVALMEDLGFARFALAGHDRGARVGYRLALDQPGRLSKLALLDIVPTIEVWRARETDPDVSPHWPWLAGPAPEPEDVIKRDPDGYFEGLMAKWTKAKNLDASMLGRWRTTALPGGIRRASMRCARIIAPGRRAMSKRTATMRLQTGPLVVRFWSWPAATIWSRATAVPLSRFGEGGLPARLSAWRSTAGTSSPKKTRTRPWPR